MAQEKVRKRKRPNDLPKTGAASGPSSSTSDQTAPAEPHGLDAIQEEVEKKFGQGIMQRADQAPLWKHIPTGILALDMALHGGIPRSQVTLLYGRESSGKTTLALKAIGNAQRMFPEQRAVHIDLEGSYDANWGAMQGIDNSKLTLVRPETGEQALDIADGIIRTPGVSIVVVDSLAALIPYREMEKSTEDSVVGMHGKLIASFCRRALSGLVTMRPKGHIPAVILLNQWRSKIGVMVGDPRILPGGQAQHYTAFTKIEMKNKEHLGKDAYDKETVDYNEHTFKIDKNKEGVAMRTGTFDMIRNPNNPLGMGFIDDGRTAATWGYKMGLITGGGGKYAIDGVPDQTFRTYEDIVQFFYTNWEFYCAFQHRIISAYRASNKLPAEGWL